MTLNFEKVIHFVNSNYYISSALSVICFGLLAGLAAKLIIPGKEDLGWFKTFIVGILGAFIGSLGANYMGWTINMGWSFIGFGVSVIGATVLILANRLVTKS